MFVFIGNEKKSRKKIQVSVFCFAVSWLSNADLYSRDKKAFNFKMSCLIINVSC